MIKALLLLSLFCVDNNIYIVTDDSEKSKIIKTEMNRNWVQKDVKKEELYELENIQCTLYNKVFIIDRYDYKACEKHRVPGFKTYPKIRIGDYTEFNDIDNRAFKASSTLIRTIYAIKINSDIDLTSYTEKVRGLKRDAINVYFQEVLEWGQKNKIDEINNLYYFEESDDALNDVITKYATKKDFPTYKPPKLPESPIIKFPWEQ